ncbi:MAG: sulfite exporter TauE/SafE family protein [Saprospiraceae bacterium]|nr:sulfite exporter TauE/SafE family protein [Saprospiraceae bacterium]MCF8251703.1 sulfite exporter TauE/SafE family protein [Saprospiraceae bacterium]MCF8281085.1 sulfite exporter TauE/SafE family protein [Bacteroidales bacterium]MCF8311757.1 sulfite exporter TauE/SafE family protein [Saprospiraceae bacterium]MCF8441793.1 sulfite exporter TauE/SafE family protein [Saprospiraceae bacterium]
MNWEIYLIFFFIAALYASVGFGGGSSYIAVLAIFGVNFLLMRSSALLCNIVVVSFGTYIFHKNGFLDLRKALPLTLASVPVAFLGGYLPIQERTFFILLSSTLLLAALLTWWRPKSRPKPENQADKNTSSQLFNLSVGSGIGFLSGMVGIGGGIFLAPVLYLTRWAEAKTIAATASLFILVNSISGILGQMAKPDFQIDWKFSIPLMIAVFLGGQLGSRLGAVKLPAIWVRRATALLIFYIGIQLLLKNL